MTIKNEHTTMEKHENILHDDNINYSSLQTAKLISLPNNLVAYGLASALILHAAIPWLAGSSPQTIILSGLLSVFGYCILCMHMNNIFHPYLIWALTTVLTVCSMINLYYTVFPPKIVEHAPIGESTHKTRRSRDSCDPYQTPQRGHIAHHDLTPSPIYRYYDVVRVSDLYAVQVSPQQQMEGMPRSNRAIADDAQYRTPPKETKLPHDRA